MLAQLSTVKSRLALLDTDNSFDALLTAALNAVSARFDQEANRTFARTENAAYEFDPHDREIAVPAYPLEVVSKFEVKTSEAEGWVEQGGIEYFIRHNCIITMRVPLTVLRSAFGVSRVVYTGGYVLPGDPMPQLIPNGSPPVRLPANVEQAAVEQVTFWFQNRDRLGLTRNWEYHGNYRNFADLDLLTSVRAILFSHRRWNV